MILQISNGRVEFSGEVLFEHADFVIKNKNEKIAIVGRNGCGKTTFLKVISGEIEMVNHENDAPCIIAKTGNPTIGYLRQISFEDENETLDDEIRKVFRRIINMKNRLDEMVNLLENPSAFASSEEHEKFIHEYSTLQETFQDIGGYYYEKEYDTMLRKFGFSMEDKAKKLSEFSGGQRTKLAFIKLLLSKPEILLLDEPTNHLDVTAIEWLEEYLKSYPYAVVVVSHDRMFLDHVVGSVYEIERGFVKYYPGNYSDFAKRKRENYEKQLKDYKAQQAEIKRLSDLAEKMKHHPTKVSMAHSKEKAIEHMDKIESPEEADNRAIHADFNPRIEPGKDILSVRSLTIGYESDKPLCNVSFEIKRGDRLGIIGGNGLGKSTLLKTLVGIIPALSGEYSYGVNVEIGYFDQQMAQYSSDKTVMDDFWDAYPNLLQTEVRNSLGAFLFTQEEVFKSVSMLSGGEKVRLALAKIFKAKPNVLILDEPTNHMDMVGKEALENMLNRYTGTVIFVSHDRYFIKQVATSVLEISESGESVGGVSTEKPANMATLYPFGYEHYLEKTGHGTAGSGALTKTVDSKDDRSVRETLDVIRNYGSEPTKAQLSYQAGKELGRLQKRLSKIEESLENAETELQNLKDELLNPDIAADYVKLKEIQDSIEAKDEEILNLMEEYDEVDSKISELNG